MHPLSRRSFFASSFAGLAAAPLLAQEPKNARDPEEKEVKPKGVDNPTFEPATLFLTWMRDPTTTMTIQWVGTAGETADTKIYYSPAKAPTAVPTVQPTTVKPYPLSDFKVYRAELAGLTPGTDYQFKIGKHSATYKFRTMPAKDTDGLQFITGGDVAVNAHAIANNIQAARQDPMFAVIGGDLGYDNGTSVEISLSFLKNYSKHMIGKDNRLIPMIPCIGNHEVEGQYGQPRAKAPFYYALFDGLFPETGYNTLDFGDYLSLVLLDTNHTSPIGGEQTEWLEKVLKARQDHPNLMVVNHVPAYPAARYEEVAPVKEGQKAKPGTGAENRKHWVPLFEKYGVPVVLEHHAHCFKRTKPLISGLANDNGVLYLGDGSWGRLRSEKKPETLAHIAASSESYHLTLHRIQGNDRFHLALDENGRVMDVAHTGQRKKGIVDTRG